MNNPPLALPSGGLTPNKPIQLFNFSTFLLYFCPSVIKLFMKIVDTKGQKCPVPIIETKKALKESNIGETFQVITDNRTSFLNISRFLGDNKIMFSVSEEKEIWIFQVTNETGTANITPAEDYCEVKAPLDSNVSFAVAVSSEIMGQGDDKLGRQLMKSFFIALSCLDEMPSVIAFYNSGVKLALEGSGVIETLLEIEKKGAEIILCGTCVDYYKVGDKIGVGKISDMYVITQKLSAARNVLKP
jgi:selenium metabolism protein YedF